MSVADEIKQALARASASVGIEIAPQEVPLEHTNDFAHGDYASSIALEHTKGAKIMTAQKIVAALGPLDSVSRVAWEGPGFINFYLAPKALGAAVEHAHTDKKWGASNSLTGKKIMVEYTDPNPFKEFHIGHLMSNAIGESIARLLDFSGAEVRRANYQGDVGPHVAKAIWGIQKLAVDAHDSAALGKAYSEGAQAYENNANAKGEIDAINAKVYDKSDATINELYAAGRAASLSHFEELYHVLGTTFDHYFFESETAPRGVALVNAHPEVFEKSDGAVVYKGEQDGLHTRVFITSKGLPTYESKELGLAELKNETWPFDTSISITAHEQADYFAVVLAAMRKVLPPIAPKLVHLSHGMMRFAEGKMSSRTGNVITGESLLEDIKEAALMRAAESRADDAKKLAQDIAVGAIKYQILRQTSGKDIIFDRERSLSLDGDSGPYLQYTHARASQIVARAHAEGIDPVLNERAEPDELSRLVHRFPEIVEQAKDLMEPHVLATYLIALSAAFNSWYAQEQILDDTEAAPHKVALTEAVRRTLKNGLWLLGIAAPGRM